MIFEANATLSNKVNLWEEILSLQFDTLENANLQEEVYESPELKAQLMTTLL